MNPIRWCAALALVLTACGGAARKPPQSEPAPSTGAASPSTSSSGSAATSSSSESAAAVAIGSEESEASLKLLDQIVQARSASLRTCYEHRGLKKNPSLSGNVVVAFEVRPDGSVGTVSFVERSWTDAQPDSADIKAVEECLIDGIRAWRFPAEAALVAGPHEFAFSFRR